MRIYTADAVKNIISTRGRTPPYEVLSLPETDDVIFWHTGEDISTYFRSQDTHYLHTFREIALAPGPDAECGYYRLRVSDVPTLDGWRLAPIPLVFTANVVIMMGKGKPFLPQSNQYPKEVIVYCDHPTQVMSITPVYGPRVMIRPRENRPAEAYCLCQKLELSV